MPLQGSQRAWDVSKKLTMIRANLTSMIAIRVLQRLLKVSRIETSLPVIYSIVLKDCYLMLESNRIIFFIQPRVWTTFYIYFLTILSISNVVLIVQDLVLLSQPYVPLVKHSFRLSRICSNLYSTISNNFFYSLWTASERAITPTCAQSNNKR